jgi:hypothetical protein
VNININKIKELSSEEHIKISNLFGLTQHNVKTLLEFGFVFDYEKKFFKSNLIINEVSYEVRIIKYNNDHFYKFYINIEYNKNSNQPQLKGADTLYLYAGLEHDIPSMHIESFLYWIKNIYELNNAKESFKEFVESEKRLIPNKAW